MTTPMFCGRSSATCGQNTVLNTALIQLATTNSSLGLDRQIFFCSLGGFDTHYNQGNITGTQASLLKQVSQAVAAFFNATVELRVASQVTTFTASDFSRTFKPAGVEAATGTDHAWGSHQFVVGGGVVGGNFYGAFPDLILGGNEDADAGTTARGRWIPAISVDQYAATLALWYGLPASELTTAFPNLMRFGEGVYAHFGQKPTPRVPPRVLPTHGAHSFPSFPVNQRRGNL